MLPSPEKPTRKYVITNKPAIVTPATRFVILAILS
jgi:hypothetical protein